MKGLYNNNIFNKMTWICCLIQIVLDLNLNPSNPVNPTLNWTFTRWGNYKFTSSDMFIRRTLYLDLFENDLFENPTSFNKRWSRLYKRPNHSLPANLIFDIEPKLKLPKELYYKRYSPLYNELYNELYNDPYNKTILKTTLKPIVE